MTTSPRTQLPMANKEIAACCDKIMRNLNAIHWACKTAAMNGTPATLDKMLFCPWCGKSMQPYEETKEALKKVEAA